MVANAIGVGEPDRVLTLLCVYLTLGWIGTWPKIPSHVTRFMVFNMGGERRKRTLQSLVSIRDMTAHSRNQTASSVAAIAARFLVIHCRLAV